MRIVDVVGLDARLRTYRTGGLIINLNETML